MCMFSRVLIISVPDIISEQPKEEAVAVTASFCLLLKELHWIHLVPVIPHFKMQMWPSRMSG